MSARGMSRTARHAVVGFGLAWMGLTGAALAQQGAPAGTPAPAATPAWPQQDQTYHLDKPLPQFAIAPDRSEQGSNKGTNTHVTVTALRRAPMPSDKVQAPAAAISRFLPHPDVALNPLKPNGCTAAYSNVGGQPANGVDIAGAAGREGCPQ